MIKYFSFRHRRQDLVVGLKELLLVITFHVMLYGTFLFLRSQMCVLKVELLVGL